MNLIEEVQLRRVIRRCIVETLKVSKGWEDYEHGLDADNSEIDVGYPAAYYEQFADSTMGLSNVAELDSGGENIITRRDNRRKKQAKTKPKKKTKT